MIMRKYNTEEKYENAIEKTSEWNDYAPAAACLGPPKPPRGLPADPRQEKETPKEPGFQIQEKEKQKKQKKQKRGAPLREDAIAIQELNNAGTFFISLPFFALASNMYIMCYTMTNRKWLWVDQWSHQSQFPHFRNQLR